MKKVTETKYYLYANGSQIAFRKFASKEKAERYAQECRTRKKNPLDVEVRKETYTFEIANFKLPGFR